MRDLPAAAVRRATNVVFRAFNRGFQKLADGYARSVEICARVWYLLLAVFVGLCLLAAYLFLTVPKGFVPEEDQGYFMTIVELPDAATIERTEAVMAQVNEAVARARRACGRR